MKLTENFSLEEMVQSATARKHGISNIPSETELKNLKRLCETVLQPIRDEWDSPIIVTSGYRCRELNRMVGGVKNSQHIKGEAADIVSSDLPGLLRLIRKMIDEGKIPVRQLIKEPGWIHIGILSDRGKK